MEHLRLYNSFSIYVSPHSLGWNDVLNRFASNWCLMSIIDILWLSFGEIIKNSTWPQLSTLKNIGPLLERSTESSTFLDALSICALCPVNVPTRDGERWGERGGGEGWTSMSDSGEERKGREHVLEGQGKTVGSGESWKKAALFPFSGCFLLFVTALRQSWG